MTENQDVGTTTSAASPGIAATTETPKIETPSTEAPKIELVSNAEVKTESAPGDAAAISTAEEAQDKSKKMFDLARLQPGYRTKIAASIAAAVIVGAGIGAIGATAYAQRGAAPAPVSNADAESLKKLLGQIGAEVAALKTGLDASTRNSSAQFVKLTERMDRAEKAQADPAARLARIGDAIERIEKRAPATTPAFTTASAPATPPPQNATAPETTGSIVEKSQQRPPVVEGWVLRDIYDGVALIESRRGLVEVFPGNTLPGLGRIEQIKKMDGRWVVVTSRGIITTSR